jgi:hypothetical protein
MPYFLIPLIVSVALAAVYVLVTDAPVWAKLLVAALLAVSFVWRFGLFLQVGLAVSILLYLKCLKART